MTQNKSLLFYASGKAFAADYAKGLAESTFSSNVELKQDAGLGDYFSCDDLQLLSWRAPGNMYTERGTLSFFWRSRYQAGPTPFPIFRVGYCDHTSWDQCWLRIDWSGEGYEAFITDLNLSRARVHVAAEAPDPNEWMHFALSWDEHWGIKLYINGKKVAQEYRPGVYAAGLDQFGPHSRIISSWQVQSAYNFIRGGDICRIAIHDQMLSCAQIATLATGEIDIAAEPYAIDMTDGATAENWKLRCGFVPAPAVIPNAASVRKVEVHNAYDNGRWYWKGLDGIRETTWPGVYNRSRLKGRNDYFQLPDWDCYSTSGRALTLAAPAEDFNNIQISGSAHGSVELVGREGVSDRKLFDRPAGKERTANFVPTLNGCRIRINNDEAEEPIGDVSLFNVVEGSAPAGAKRVSYALKNGCAPATDAERELAAYIDGRYQPYERNTLTAVPGAAEGEPVAISGYPFANIVIPYEADDAFGLDGVEIAFGKAKGDTCAAVQIKDPLWYMRNLLHFVFSAGCCTEKTIWFDTRDRVLPEGKCLYITVAADTAEKLEALLTGARLTLVYKTFEQAKPEHTIDRFTQVRDLYGHITEESPSIPVFYLYNRVMGDVMDLRKVSPEHFLGQCYYFNLAAQPARWRPAIDPDFRPDYDPPKAPEGTPEWAFNQVEQLKWYKRLINWYIDNRQVENGELGGGLSDDGDYVATWGWLPMMGSDTEKVYRAMVANTDAFYNTGMFTNGLCTIQADELHSSEEGLVSVAACLMANNGDPKMLERAMETARNIEWMSGINSAGHRHFKSSYYNGTKMALEAPWNVSQPADFSAISPIWQLSRFNGNPQIRTWLKEFADSILAHYDPEHPEQIGKTIRFEDDAEVAVTPRIDGMRNMVNAAAAQLGNEEYRRVFETITAESNLNTKGGTLVGGKAAYLPMDANGVLDKAAIAGTYDAFNRLSAINWFYNTDGSCWIDRVKYVADIVACHRVGDPTGQINRAVYPMGHFGWRFRKGDDEKIAILAPVATTTKLKILVCNISDTPVTAKLLGDEVDPGTWAFRCGIDTCGGDCIDTETAAFEAAFERTSAVELTFAPGATTVVEAELKTPGTPYWQRCDLGIGPDDLHFFDHGLNVTVHSLGAVATPAVDVVIKNAEGKVLKRETLIPMEAPTDLLPRRRDVTFNLHNVPSLEGCYVEIDPDNTLCEITRSNNIVRFE